MELGVKVVVFVLREVCQSNYALLESLDSRVSMHNTVTSY